MNVAIIQARMNGRRFPGKVLKKLAGKPILLHVIERVRKAALVDRVIVAVPGQASSDAIGGHCKEWDAECIATPHPQDNVLGRFVAVTQFVAAAEQGGPKLVVRVCADNPMINPVGIDELLEAAAQYGCDYTAYRAADGTPMILQPTGWFAEVVQPSALRRADRYLSSVSPAREHVTAWLYRKFLPDQYSCHWVDLPAWYVDNDLPNTAIDTPEDLEELESWLAEFDNKENWPWK